MRNTLFLALLFLCIIACYNKQVDVQIVSSPSWEEYAQIDVKGKTILPNGRLLTPAGKSLTTAPHAYGLAISSDGSVVVTVNSGTNPLSITIIRNALSAKPEIQQVPPGANTDDGVLASVFMGVGISPDNQKVYVSGGQENRIYIFEVKTGKKLGFIDCSSKSELFDYSAGYIGDLILSKDGKRLYAVDQINFRMIIIDTQSNKVLYSVPVGRYPFGIALSPDEKKVYVANVGMYEYSQIPGVTEKNVLTKGLKYPAFSYLSEESKNGVKVDTTFVPGLGEPNAIEAFSVFAVDISNKEKPTVCAKIKTGFLVGQKVEEVPAVGGASPNSLVATDKYVFVSNGTNDNISVIDIKKDTVVATIFLKPDYRVKNFRGVIPFGLALSPDKKTLYAAESGINAVAVIDIASFKVLGHIPVGWFPSKLKVTADGKTLIVANAKGYGSGPNGGINFQEKAEGSYIGNLMKGSVSFISIPKDKELSEMTKKVVSNNYQFSGSNDEKFAWRKNNPIPLYPGEKESPIKYIVFISKENRTFDEIFGQVKGAKGDSTLARYGKNVTFSNHSKKTTVEHATVMPNHLQLAQRFSISDNFYVDADVSADGHRWLVNTYPNEWVEATVPANYGGNREFKYNTKSPGMNAFNGAAGAIYPEDYNEAGSMWDHLDRNKIGFYNFGFSLMFEPASYHESYKQGGIRFLFNYPMPKPLFDNSSRTYPTYNTAIPDQFRMDMFIKEFKYKWSLKGTKIPSVLTVIIPNDHGAGERPEAGYPFRESYMADNDLAVGRIVEFLSHTKYWKNMLIVVTEDDAQNGRDHIDAHRSVLMAFSPYAKKDYVSHVHYSFGSIFKTFWNILGIPYLNQYDAAANDMADFFTDVPDFSPYNAIAPDFRIFDPVKALSPLNEKFDWKALKESPKIDNVKDMLKDAKENKEDRLH